MTLMTVLMMTLMTPLMVTTLMTTTLKKITELSSGTRLQATDQPCRRKEHFHFVQRCLVSQDSHLYIWKTKKTIFDPKTQLDNQKTTNQTAKQPTNQTSKHQITNQSTTSVLTPSNCPPPQALAARAGGLRTPLLEDDRESCV